MFPMKGKGIGPGSSFPVPDISSAEETRRQTMKTSKEMVVAPRGSVPM